MSFEAVHLVDTAPPTKSESTPKSISGALYRVPSAAMAFGETLPVLMICAHCASSFMMRDSRIPRSIFSAMICTMRWALEYGASTGSPNTRLLASLMVPVAS